MIGIVISDNHYTGLHARIGLLIVFVMAFIMIAMPTSALTPKAVSTGGDHTLILMDDGTVWGMGVADLGILGNNVSFNANDPLSHYIVVPIKVEGLDDVTQIAAGWEFSMARKNDGTLWTWGSNDKGQLGIGDISADYTGKPHQVPGLSSVVSIVAHGSNAIALCDNGSVWMWGDNFNGQIPNCSEQIRKNPIQIPDVPGVEAISYGILLDDKGIVWEFGDYGVRRLNDSNLANVKAISSGGDHKLALNGDGTVWAWGENYLGLLGNGNGGIAKTITTPIEVKGLTGIKYICAGVSHNIAIGDDDTLWIWGANDHGELGIGVVKTQTTPSEGLSTAPAHDYRDIPVSLPGMTNIRIVSLGQYDTVALADNGTIWGWGDNSYGQLGDVPEYLPAEGKPTIKDYPYEIRLSPQGNDVSHGPSKEPSSTLNPGATDSISPSNDNLQGLCTTRLLAVIVLLIIVFGVAGYFVLRKR